MSGEENVKSLIKVPVISLAISIILGIVITIVGVTVFGNWVYSEIMYLLVGLMLIIFSIIGIARLYKAETKVKAGEVCITHGWWVFSTGIGGIIVYAAPFFTRGLFVAGASAAVASGLSIIFGLIVVLYARSRLGVSLAV